MLKREFKYYVENQDRFVEKYNGKVIVLQGEEVIGTYDDLSDAYWYAVDSGLLGKVLIHKVEPGQDNYTLTIHSSLVFA